MGRVKGWEIIIFKGRTRDGIILGMVYGKELSFWDGLRDGNYLFGMVYGKEIFLKSPLPHPLSPKLFVIFREGSWDRDYLLGMGHGMGNIFWDGSWDRDYLLGMD